jgi:hypothetical protein
MRALDQEAAFRRLIAALKAATAALAELNRSLGGGR